MTEKNTYTKLLIILRELTLDTINNHKYHIQPSKYYPHCIFLVNINISEIKIKNNYKNKSQKFLCNYNIFFKLFIIIIIINKK